MGLAIRRTQALPRTRTRARAHTLAWAGVMAVAGTALWLGVVGFAYLGQWGQVGAQIAMARGQMVGPALVVAVVGIFIAEQRWPAVRRPVLARAHLVDAFYFGFFALAVVPALTLVQTGVWVEVQRHASFLVLAQLPVASRGVAVVLALLAMDAANWAAHLANHRYASFWRLHALHHSQEDMSVFTTFRTHPLIHATYLPAAIPAVVLGANGGLPAAAMVVYGCLVALPHANLSWTFGPLGKVFVSPAYHRTHHLRELGPDGAVNFGFVLVVWDRLAHRACFRVYGAPLLTGLAQRPVPVEQHATLAGVPRVVLVQLAQPFLPGPAVAATR